MAENVRVTLANFRKVSQALADSLGRQQAELSEIVVNIRDASQHAKALAANLQEISDERKEDVKVALAKFRSVGERLDGILARVEDGQGMLAKLLNDPKMGQELEKTMTNVNQATGDLKGFVGRIAAIKLYWDYRQRFDLEDDQWHPDLGVYMYPRPEKYYYVGGNNLGSNQDWKDDPEADAERRNRITAILGHDFGPVTLYGGLIRSAGGAGLKFRPLPKDSSWHRRVELEAEAYDFGRDVTIQGGKLTLQGPVYNAGARVKAVDPWLWLGGQVEDAAERRNLTVNANLVFRDEDLTFLLGLIGLAR
jgi:phospholipid/cholesterol/gamma-HCH transport system substrate-binding protein